MSGTQLFCIVLTGILVLGGVGIAWADAFAARRRKRKRRPLDDQPWEGK